MNKQIILSSLLIIYSLSGFANELEKAYNEVIAIYKTDDYEATRTAALEFLDKAKSNEDYAYMCKSYFLLGYISEYNDDFGKAIIYYLEGSRFGQLSTEPDIYKTVVSIHKNLADVLGDYKHYNLAHRFIDEGIEIAKNHNLGSQVESLMNNKVHEFLEEDRYLEALQYIDSIRVLFPEMDESRLVKLNNKEGVAYHNLGNLDRALISYSKAIEGGNALGLDVQAICTQNIGSILQEKGNYNLALQKFRETVNYCKEYKYSRWEFQAYQKIGDVYFNLNQLDSALYYYQEAIKLVKQGDQDALSYEIFHNVSQVYSSMRKFETALKYKEIYTNKLKEYIALQNSIAEQEQQYNIQLLTDRYYDLLAADMEQKETERLAKFGIGGTASFFLIILSIMVYRQRRTKVLLAREINELHLTSEV